MSNLLLRGFLSLNAILDFAIALYPRTFGNPTVADAFPTMSADAVDAIGACMPVHAFLRAYGAFEGFKEGSNKEARTVGKRAAQLSYLAEIVLAAMLRKHLKLPEGSSLIVIPAIAIAWLEYTIRDE